MRNLIKKSLAFLLVATLALTCFVGTLTVSAENATPTATIVITADAVEAGATQIPVTFTVTSTVGINEALIKVSSDLGDIIAQPTVVVNEGVGTAIADNAGNATDYNAFYLSAVSPDGQAETVMGEITKATITAVFVNEAGIAAKETPYTVNVEIPEGKVIAASKDEVAIDLVCDGLEIVVEEVASCDHANATKEVTTQPTKDAEGVMTYTCECGETWTEAIAKPVATTAVTFKGDIVVSSVVGANITVSTKQMRTTYGDDSEYFIVVNYQKYGVGYVLGNESVTLTAANRIPTSTANKDVITFADIALYEMTLDFTMTAYFVNGEGVVVGYREFASNIADMAKGYCAANPTNTKLLTSMADMCAYGDAAQLYFSSKNAGSDICDAVLPSTILGETYMANKSTTDGMPAIGEFNNDKGSTKLVSSTGFVSAGQTLVIGASNEIKYTLRYDNYDWNNVEIKVYYEDSITGLKEVTLTAEDLIENGTASNGQPKFTYSFAELALYDCDKTVTMDMYYNGVKELTSVYSFGNFVNVNLSKADLTDLLTTMELFSNSIGIQLGLPARW